MHSLGLEPMLQHQYAPVSQNGVSKVMCLIARDTHTYKASWIEGESVWTAGTLSWHAPLCFMRTSNMPSIIEDLSVSVLLVFWAQNILQEVCAFVRSFNSHSIPDVAFVPVDAIRCCVRVSKNISKRLLQSVSRHQIQDKSGVCDIDAVVWVFNTQTQTQISPVLLYWLCLLIYRLFIKNKRICAHPRVLQFLEKLKKHHKPKRTQAKTE